VTNSPTFLCLMPVWNHRHETIENAVQCFLDQRYKNAYLAIIDDRPEDARIKDWHRHIKSPLVAKGVLYLPFAARFGSIAAKYNGALQVLKMDKFSHIAIWDDDDGFTEDHLQAAASQYLAHPQGEVLWTYPDKVFTTYGGNLNVEPTEGRFWSSITFDTQCLAPWGRFFPIRKNIGQDQMFLHELQNRYGDRRAAPKELTYVYRWGKEGEQHWSGISRGFNCEASWDECPYSVSGKPLNPQYDEYYVETRKEIAQYLSA